MLTLLTSVNSAHHHATGLDQARNADRICHCCKLIEQHSARNRTDIYS
jgi:hypothetical protein